MMKIKVPVMGNIKAEGEGKRKMEFVKVKKDKFYYKGKPILFTGLGIGSWLNMEHFMLGIPTPQKQIKEAFTECFGKERSCRFFEEFVSAFVGEEDFVFMKQLGINLIRVPFHYSLFLDDRETGQVKEEGFSYFDRLLALCTKYEIFLLPDLHAVPGGQNPDWHSDNQTGVSQFWQYKVFRQQMEEVWRSFAARYSEEPYLLGYDLLNEPYLMSEEKELLQEFYEDVTRAIRQADGNHIIFLEGDFFAMDISVIKEIQDEQTAITFHFYPTVWEPDLCNENYPKEKRRKIFEERFYKIFSQMQVHKRPLLCGEAGYDIEGRSLSQVMEMVEDTLELFKKYGVSWTLWSYKDACFMGLVYPKRNSLWMRFAEEIRQNWTHYREMEMGKELVEIMCAGFPGIVKEDLKYELQFRQRALLFLLQKEQILKPQLQRWGWEKVCQMPDSFKMENCEFYKEYEEVLKKYTLK